MTLKERSWLSGRSPAGGLGRARLARAGRWVSGEAEARPHRAPGTRTGVLSLPCIVPASKHVLPNQKSFHLFILYRCPCCVFPYLHLKEVADLGADGSPALPEPSGCSWVSLRAQAPLDQEGSRQPRSEDLPPDGLLGKGWRSDPIYFSPWSLRPCPELFPR